MKKKEELIKNKWMTSAPLYIDEKDKRYKKYVKQLKKKGFSDTETWSLFSVIAEFVLPRLKGFKDVNMAHPSEITSKEWNVILDKMIFAFEWTLIEGGATEEYFKMRQAERDASWKKHEEGMKLFAKWLMALWW